MIKNCVICGKPFECYGKGLTCSPECRAIQREKYLEEFYQNEENRERKKKYDREYRRREREKEALRKNCVKNCVICGKPFECYGRAVTCSPECRAEHNKRRLEKKREYDREYRRRKKEKEAIRRQRQDSIIGEGYAERQIAQTLSMVEPIKTEL